MCHCWGFFPFKETSRWLPDSFLCPSSSPRVGMSLLWAGEFLPPTPRGLLGERCVKEGVAATLPRRPGPEGLRERRLAPCAGVQVWLGVPWAHGLRTPALRLRATCPRSAGSRPWGPSRPGQPCTRGHLARDCAEHVPVPPGRGSTSSRRCLLKIRSKQEALWGWS